MITTEKIFSKNEEWVKIFSTTEEYEVIIKKALLEKNDIIVVHINKKDSSFNNFGLHFLMVKKKQLEKARLILTSKITHQ